MLPIKRVARIFGGSTPSADSENWDGEVNWLAPTDISAHHGGYVGDSARKLTPTGLDGCGATVCPAGSVVVTTRAPIGNVAITTQPSGTNQGCRTIVPGPNLDPRFLRYQLQTRATDLQLLGSGATFLELSGTALGGLAVAILPLVAQRKVAEFLDRECVRIAELSSELRGADSVIEEAEQQLVDACLVEAPVLRLGWVAEVHPGLTLGKNYDDHELEIFPYLRVANVQAGRLDLAEIKEVSIPPSQAVNCLLRAGDVLMTEGGDIDKLGRGTVWHGEIPGCLHQNHVFAVRPIDSYLAPAYLAIVTRSSLAREYFESTATRSTNLASTNSQKVRSFRFPVPPVSDQQRIVVDFLTRGQAIRSAKTEIGALRSGLSEYRDALITDAVTGKLDVSTVSETQMDEAIHAAREGERPEVLAS